MTPLHNEYILLHIVDMKIFINFQLMCIYDNHNSDTYVIDLLSQLVIMLIKRAPLTAISLHADIEIPVPSICFKA